MFFTDLTKSVAVLLREAYTRIKHNKKGRMAMEKSEKISILQDVVKIKSVNGNEEEVAIYLQNLLKKYEIPSELVSYAPNRSSLVAYLGENREKVLGFSGTKVNGLSHHLRPILKEINCMAVAQRT